jgi:hypothetical protein
MCEGKLLGKDARLEGSKGKIWGIPLRQSEKGKNGNFFWPSRKKKICEGKLLGQNVGSEGSKARFGVSLYEKVKKEKMAKNFCQVERGKCVKASY